MQVISRDVCAESSGSFDVEALMAYYSSLHHEAFSRIWQVCPPPPPKKKKHELARVGGSCLMSTWQMRPFSVSFLKDCRTKNMCSKSWKLQGRGSKCKEQIGQLFEHELQLSSSTPQRIVIDYSSPNIAKASWTTGARKLWISCIGDELRTMHYCSWCCRYLANYNGLTILSGPLEFVHQKLDDLWWLFGARELIVWLWTWMVGFVVFPTTLHLCMLSTDVILVKFVICTVTPKKTWK